MAEVELLGDDAPTAETLACFLMTFLDPTEPGECHAVVDLMTKMVPLFCESYAARQREAPD